MFEHYLVPWLGRYGYLALFASVFIESFGIPAPGESIVIASALLAGHGKMYIVWVMLSAWAAAVLGDNVGYAIGRWGGKRVLQKLPIQAEHLTYVEQFFRRYGGGVVVVARFFIILRQLNGVMAGSLLMPWWRFLLFNMCGAALWVSFWAGGAYFLGTHFEEIVGMLHGVTVYVLGVGLLGLVGVGWYLWERNTITK